MTEYSGRQSDQQQTQLEQQLTELATNLQIQLGIPLQQQLNPLDLNFVTECINVLFVRLNPKWKPISFQAYTQQQIDEAWKKIFKIVSSTLLQQGQTLINQDQQVGIQNIVTFYQVLCQGCEALRYQNPYLVSKIDNRKNIQQNQNNNKSEMISQINNKKFPKNSRQGIDRKQSVKIKSKQKSNEKNKAKNTRPKTGISNILSQNFERQIIQNVNKTMAKIYNKRSQPKRQARIREKEGTQAVQKAKRTLDYAIKDYQLSNRLTNKKIKQAYSKTKKKDLVDHAYMKMVETKHKRLNQEIDNQQLRYYLQLRDKKVAYVRHIHKLIEKLQKQRQIESNKRQRQIQISKKKQMIQKIQNVDNLFSQNMQNLQQNYQNRRKVQQLQNVGQKQVCRAMQKVMKQKKMKQIEDIQNLWRQQRNQLHKITTDEQRMKNKLIQIYRKHNVS